MIYKIKKFVKWAYERGKFYPVLPDNIAEGLSYGVHWQDQRKKNIFIYLHYKELFLKEVARRRHYNEDAMRNLSTWEVIEAIKKDVMRCGKS